MSIRNRLPLGQSDSRISINNDIGRGPLSKEKPPLPSFFRSASGLKLPDDDDAAILLNNDGLFWLVTFILLAWFQEDLERGASTSKPNKHSFKAWKCDRIIGSEASVGKYGYATAHTKTHTVWRTLPHWNYGEITPWYTIYTHTPLWGHILSPWLGG